MANNQDAIDLMNKVQALREALEATQWGFNHVRCPVCAGWDGESETDKFHSRNCIVKAALKMTE